MALVDPEMRLLLGVPLQLRPVGSLPVAGEEAKSTGRLPLAGLVAISPTVDIGCTGTSMLTNCWGDAGNRSGDIANMGSCQQMSAEERVWDCEWSYLLYMFGLEVGQRVANRRQGHLEYMSRPAGFWTSPRTNPLFFNYSAPGFPAVLVITGAADYFASDGINLAARLCAAGLPVEHFIAEAMWHDFVEYSEGCGHPGGGKLAAGLEAYRRIGEFAQLLRS